MLKFPFELLHVHIEHDKIILLVQVQGDKDLLALPLKINYINNLITFKGYFHIFNIMFNVKPWLKIIIYHPLSKYTPSNRISCTKKKYVNFSFLPRFKSFNKLI